MTGFKVCRTCQQCKPVEMFYREKRLADGLSNKCKACKDQAQALYWEKHPGKRAEYARNAKRRRAKAKRAQERRRQLLTQERDAVSERYVRRLLAKDIVVPQSAIPAALVELKREQILMARATADMELLNRWVMERADTIARLRSEQPWATIRLPSIETLRRYYAPPTKERE